MKAKIENDFIDLSKPLDISIPLRGDSSNVNAWYVEHPRIEPHSEGDFVGKVSEGASINFNNIQFNPHAHGTHTECVGHITADFHSVNQKLSRYFFKAEVITLAPEKYQEDLVISRKQLQYALGNKKREALVIRTLPNLNDKLNRQYSNTNPPYLLEQAAEFLVEKGIELIRSLHGNLSGLAVPQYVIDAPGGGGKVPILGSEQIRREGDDIVFFNYKGEESRYPDPV